ncbi:MAG: AMP-binding protein [Steroidobacteraceae bacterium]
MTGTLIDSSKWWAAIRKDQPAIVTQDDRITYAELDTWAEALCDWLIDEGVQVGDRVSIFATNCLEWCILAQGIMRAGAILAPVNARFTVSEASYMLGRYESKVLFHDSARKDAAEELLSSAPDLRLKSLSEVTAFRKRPSSRRDTREGITADTNVVIIPTSGSTARPKGVVYSHRTMLNYQTEFALAEPAAIDHARLLLFAPLSTSAGYVLLTQFLAYGGTVYVYDAFDPERALECIVEEKITSVMGAPVFLERIAACDGFAEADLSHVRMTSCGGARVSRQLLEAWMKKGVLLRQIYGQTEVGGQCTINTLEAAVTNPEKCGRGMPFTRMAIMDSAGNFLPPNTPGEIVVKGPGTMVGYWNDPEATAKTVVDGWLHTGDLGVIDEDGLLTMLDRIKDIIISGGLNISAAELERVISEFPGIDEVAAIAAKDERFGETPLAVLYSSSGIDVKQLIAHCCKHLSDYKVPRYVAVEKEPLPRLATGKIAKPPLRAKYVNAHEQLPRVR